MWARGIDISDARPKHLERFVRRRFDYVVTLCDHVREVCPDFPGAPERIHWSIADPSLEGEDGIGRAAAFARAAAEIDERVRFLLYLIHHQHGARRQ